MLCWAANLVEAYNKEVRVGFKDRVMVLLRPSKGGGVEDMYKLTKGRSVYLISFMYYIYVKHGISALSRQKHIFL